MSHILLSRFERRVLRPTWFAHSVLIIILGFQHHFLVLVPLTILWLLYGMVGQALHKDLTANQMARGEHVSQRVSESELELLSPKDSTQLGKALIGFTLIFSLTALTLAIHLGVRWFFTILFVLLACVLSFILSLLLAGGDAFLRIWRHDKSVGANQTKNGMP
jgi:hypothetical protein